ncbi:MAG: RsmB/NOP family class I SAM-dependent RNA methyltransferase [Paracoccaceae bacterium]
MTPAARIQAAIDILDDIGGGKPAEQALTGWARRSRFAGSGDRAAIRDHVFDVLRQRESCAAYGGGQGGRQLVLGLLRQTGVDPDTVFTGERFAPSILAEEERKQSAPDVVPDDLPDWLRPYLERSLEDRLGAVAQALKHRAPVHLRVNLRKSSLQAAQDALLEDGIETQSHPAADMALEITDGPRKLRQSSAYKNGIVELQDAASQAVVAMLPLQPAHRVLDYCAGGGGKALAMAAAADVTVDAHDIAPDRMRDIPDRSARAGVRISRVDTQALRGPYDLILCDAPCSGSGSWRRAPEGKWRLTPERLTELTEIQDNILQKAAALTAPDGVLAYATCSLLRDENEDRIARFCAAGEWVCDHDHRWYPDEGTDGFYLALLKRS